VVRSLQKVPNIIFIPTPKIFLHLFTFFNFRTIRIIFTMGQSYRSSFFTTFIICSMFVKIPVSS
jgi:hypothetical protein